MNKKSWDANYCRVRRQQFIDPALLGFFFEFTVLLNSFAIFIGNRCRIDRSLNRPPQSLTLPRLVI